MLRRDGTPGWTFSRAIPLLNGDGEIVEWFGLASDVTQRMEAEEQLAGVEVQRSSLLPASLSAGGAIPTVRLGDLGNPCTHILKVPAHEHPGLIENEWATMELARRIGLPVAPVAMVEFEPETRYRGRSLLVERYDIPTRAALDQGGAQLQLGLQEDACSLLLLRRDEKYTTSHERIAAALLDAGLSREVGGDGMWRYLQVVLFSWIVGNGDLHAKNISLLRRFRPGRPGEPPVLEQVELTRFYDLGRHTRSRGSPGGGWGGSGDGGARNGLLLCQHICQALRIDRCGGLGKIS